MSFTTKFIPHSLIGIVSVLPALLIMPAMATDDHGVLIESTTISADVSDITRTVTDADENGAYKNKVIVF